MFYAEIVVINWPVEQRPQLIGSLLKLGLSVNCFFQSVHEARQALKDGENVGYLFFLYMGGEQDLHELSTLGEMFPEALALAFVENQQLVFRVMRRGAAQIVPLPIDPDDLKEALDCIARQGLLAKKKSSLIVVSGVNGGCGATTAVLNFAYEVSLLAKQSVALMEISPYLGSLANYLNIKPKYTIRDLFHSHIPFDRVMVETALERYGEHLLVLVDEYREFVPLHFHTADVVRLTNLFRIISSTVFLDVPCNCRDFYFDMLANADGVVLVGEQTMQSICALQYVLASLKNIEGIGQLMVLLNRFDPNKADFQLARLEALLEGVPIVTRPYDQHVIAATNAGCPVRLISPEAPFVQETHAQARQFVSRMTGQPIPKPPPSPSFRMTGQPMPEPPPSPSLLRWLTRVFPLGS